MSSLKYHLSPVCFCVKVKVCACVRMRVYEREPEGEKEQQRDGGRKEKKTNRLNAFSFTIYLV